MENRLSFIFLIKKTIRSKRYKIKWNSKLLKGENASIHVNFVF